MPKAEAPGWLAGPNHLNRLLHDQAIGWGLWNKLYSRRLIEAVKWPVGVRHNEDLWANWRLFAAADGLYFDPCAHLLLSADRRLGQPPHPDTGGPAGSLDGGPGHFERSGGHPSEESARAFHYEKMLYLYSMALRQKDMAPYRLSDGGAGRAHPAEFGPAMAARICPVP